MDIKSLPQDVRAHLRSGANINSVRQCVMELVLNSLDAKSTAIAVRVNLITFRIQVVDNGKGITKSNMNLVGIRYMTSKCQSLADLKKIKRFGFRGEALASIRNMSKRIVITSKPENVENTYSKTFENGKWNGVELVKERPSKGTTLTVEGFMHNLPVRQKRIDQNLDFHELRRSLEGLAVIHPNVSFNLRNDANGKLILQSNKTQTVSQALVNFYPDILIEDLLEVKVSKSKICVSGLICKKPSPNSKLQFVYLNKRPIASPKIQNLVNSLLLKSLIFRKSSLTFRPGGFLNFATPVEKTDHPVYIINIRCPYSEVDLTLSPSKKTVEFKQWNVVLTCIEKAVVKLLEHENLINPNVSTQQVDLPAVPSVKSQFGVSQIKGAVKSVPVKRKIVVNPMELQQKCPKIDTDLNKTKSGFEREKRLSTKDAKDEKTVDVQKGLESSTKDEKGENTIYAQKRLESSTTKSSFNGVKGTTKILTLAEVHNERKIRKRRTLESLPLDPSKNCQNKNFNKVNLESIIEGANDIHVLSLGAKSDQRKVVRLQECSRKDIFMQTNKGETYFKILPAIAKYPKGKNVEGRPTWLGKTKTGTGKNVETSFNQDGEIIKSPEIRKNLGKTKRYKTKNVKTNPKKDDLDIQNNVSDGSDYIDNIIVASNSKNVNNIIKIGSSKPQMHDPKINNHLAFKKKDVTNHHQNFFPVNTGTNIPTNIFDKHKNTQSLVLNSELNASKPNDNPLLNSTVNTSTLENQHKGKDLIMDMFLKSAMVFSKERSEVKDETIKTVVVETTKENLIRECRNQNTTMMTVSWKIMSKKTIVTNSVHPTYNLEKGVPENGKNMPVRNMDDESLEEELKNNCKENQCPQETKPIENHGEIRKGKMISKCVQTTMIEHQKEFKIDVNCVPQPGPDTNSNLFFPNSVPKNDKYNVTFSKYFERSRREENNKPEEYCFPDRKTYRHFENDLKSNNIRHDLYNFGGLQHKFGTDHKNCDYNLNENYIRNLRRYNKPTIPFENHQYLNNMKIPHFGNTECPRRPMFSHNNFCDAGNYFNNFPKGTKNFGNYCNLDHYDDRHNNEISSKYDLYGKTFRKPIKKYFSDYNFDFSNLSAIDEPYKQFVGQNYNFGGHHNRFPFVGRTRTTNPLENFNQQHKVYGTYDYADLTFDVPVPLYQSYNPYRPNELRQHSNYHSKLGWEPMISTNNYINFRDEVQHPIGGKTERFHSRNNNQGHFDPMGALQEELYKSIIRDYGQENCFQTINDQKIDEQVAKGKNENLSNLEKHHLGHHLPVNIFFKPSYTKPKMEKQTLNQHKPVHQPKSNKGANDNKKQMCYSPYFQKPVKKAEPHREVFKHHYQNPEYHQQRCQYHETKDIGQRKNLKPNQDFRTKENREDIHYVSPFFRKISNDALGTEAKTDHLAHKHQKFWNVPIKEAASNYYEHRPTYHSKLYRADKHQEDVFPTLSSKRSEVPLQQLNHKRPLLYEQPQQQQFFLPQQSNNFFRNQNNYLLEDDEKENHAEIPRRKFYQRKLEVQDQDNLFAAQQNKLSLKNPVQQLRQENKLLQNPMIFMNNGKGYEQQQNDFLFSTEKPLNDCQLVPPRNSRNLHQKSKLSLKKFDTEPLQQKHSEGFFHTISNKNSKFQQKSEPTIIKEYSTEPFRTNFFTDVKEDPARIKFDLSLDQSKSFFVDLTTPKINSEMEFSITTPNINQSNTIDDSIEEIYLDDSENVELSKKEVEVEEEEEIEESNLTVCSKNFKPALSSTRIDIEENHGKNNVHLLNNVPEKNEQPQSVQQNFDFGSDVIEDTPTKNFDHFFIPSLNQIKVNNDIEFFDKPQKNQCHQRQENDVGSKKSCSALNISINAIKKSKLIEKGMANDCKLNKNSESGESGQSNINFVNLENYNMANLLDGHNLPLGENKNDDDLGKFPAEDEWTQKVNKCGSAFYVHKRTGMTSKFSPKQDSHFKFTKRFGFVPKGLSPIFIETKKIDSSLSPTSKKSLHAAILESYENELNTVKWSNYIFDYNDVNKFFEELYREKTKQFGGCIPNTSLNELPKSMVKLCNNLRAQSFTKDIFADLEIIDYKESENDLDTIKFKSTKCNENVNMKLTSADINILINFKNLFENLGLQYAIFENCISITHIPTCIYNKSMGSNEKNKELSLENIIDSLIYEQIAMIMSTRGVTSKMPNVLQNVINSEACRGAVKFGEKLTINECKEHIKELSNCKLPFQCAHGRPTLTPLVSLKRDFAIKKLKPNLKNLKIII